MKIKPELLKTDREYNDTVLEGGGSQVEELDLWSQGYSLRDHSNSPINSRWNSSQSWCKPSCIPISIILILIFLVVLLPLLDHAMEKDNEFINRSYRELYNGCPNSCKMSLVETMPEGLTYPNGSITFPSTYDTWLDLINNAEESIEIASFYWTLRRAEVYDHPSSQMGEDVFQALLKAGTDRGIEVKIAQNAPSKENPNLDTELLVKRKAAEVRSLNFAQIIGSGVLHTKLWIIDRRHVYIGSANMDWRSLAQVKEMGAVIHNCSCIVEDISKIFDVYWYLGGTPKIPVSWPDKLSTKINKETPMNLTLNDFTFETYVSNSPPKFTPAGRTDDLDSILTLISHAEQFIYISVMEFTPLTVFTPRIKFWPAIDSALRAVAIDNKVKVNVMVAHWNHTRKSDETFLKSLVQINGAFKNVKVEVKYFTVPASEDQKHIPFARVNHCKYMVTDNAAYIGTSNWSGDYFIDTAGVGLAMKEPPGPQTDKDMNIRAQLQAAFERDWNSEYTTSLTVN